MAASCKVWFPVILMMAFWKSVPSERVENMEQCSSFPSLEKSATNYLFAGNPGAGKSTLLNGLMGKHAFKSGVVYDGAGMTKHLQVVKVDPHTFLDTPGLDDIDARRKAAEEITLALRHGGAFKIVFVMSLDEGRLRPADITTMRLILEAAPIGTNYGILINKLPLKLVNHYTNNLQQRNALLAKVFATLPHSTEHFTWIAHDENLASADDQVACVPSHVLAWLHELPSVVIPPDEVSNIKDDNFDAFKEEVEKQLNKLTEQNSHLTNLVAQKNDEMQKANERFQSQMQKANERFESQMAEAMREAAAANKRAEQAWNRPPQILERTVNDKPGPALPPIVLR